MSTITPPQLYTAEDLLAMPNGDMYELEDGQLVKKEMSLLSSFVAGLIYGLVLPYCQKTRAGWPFPEGTSYQCFSGHPNRVRKPDVSFIRRDRLSQVQLNSLGHCLVTPDLAVEVLSPGDTAYKVDAKVQLWLQAGVSRVWVVNPEQRTVEIHRASGAGAILRETDEVSGEDVMPGFHCRVADFFSMTGEPANEN